MLIFHSANKLQFESEADQLTSSILTRVSNAPFDNNKIDNIQQQVSSSVVANNDTLCADEVYTGWPELAKLSLWRFPDDERVREVYRLLNSSKPLYLKVEKQPDMSEMDFRQKQQLKLSLLCRR